MTLLDFFILGFVSGFSPGPIMALCLGESLKHGAKHAFVIPFSIPVANLFIAPAMVMALAIGSQVKGVLEVIPYFGALLLIYLGMMEWKNAENIDVKTVSRPFIKGIFIDLLSPFGYLLWLTVLGPTALFIWKEDGIQGFSLYWIVFFIGVVGALLILIFVADLIRPFLTSAYVRKTLRGLALVLILFGIKMLL